MATAKRIEELEVWRLARELNKSAFSFFRKIISCSDYKLMNQMSGACGSIMDNIAEGFGRGGNKEFIYFLSIAKASGEEFKSQLYRASDRKYITKEEFETAFNDTCKVCSKIGAFIKYLEKSDFKGIKYSQNFKHNNHNQTTYNFKTKSVEPGTRHLEQGTGTKNSERETRSKNAERGTGTEKQGT